MTTLRYRGYHVDPSELAIGECTIRPAGNEHGTWWHLWAYVLREDNGQPVIIGCPLHVNGGYSESGPGGKTWGFTRSGPNTWQVAPSINVLVHGEVHPGDHPSPSMWHQTPAIVDVPDVETWQTALPLA